MTTESAPVPEQSLTWRILAALPPVLLLAGIAFLVYPVVATQHNNAEQQRAAAAYGAEVSAQAPDVLAQELASADAYNQEGAEAPILDPWIDAQRPNSDQYQRYLRELDLDPVMGQVVIPSINVDLPIYHGTTPDVLDKGVGHLFGTALPVGGPSTHTVLTGHTGLSAATLFDHLTDVRVGDAFYLHVAGRHLKYRVDDIRVVLPNETATLNKVEGEDLATLITCTPYSVNSHRLLVTGERVEMDDDAVAAEAAGVAPSTVQPWMVWVLAAVAVIVVVAVSLAVRGRLVGRRRAGRAPASGLPRPPDPRYGGGDGLEHRRRRG